MWIFAEHVTRIDLQPMSLFSCDFADMMTENINGELFDKKGVSASRSVGELLVGVRVSD